MISEFDYKKAKATVKTYEREQNEVVLRKCRAYGSVSIEDFHRVYDYEPSQNITTGHVILLELKDANHFEPENIRFEICIITGYVGKDEFFAKTEDDMQRYFCNMDFYKIVGEQTAIPIQQINQP